MAEFFGFEINRKGNKATPRPSFVPDTESDGAGVIQTGGHFGVYLDIDGDKVKNEVDLIMKYRDCLLYTSPSPRDGLLSRMPSSA